MSCTLGLRVERAFPTDLPEHYIGLTFPQRCVLSWGSPFDANCVSYCRLTDKTIFIVAVISMGKQEALNRFSTDLTEKARKGEIDPIVGRDEETRQIVDVLMADKSNQKLIPAILFQAAS